MTFLRRSSMLCVSLSSALLVMGLSGCHRQTDQANAPQPGSVAAAQAAAQAPTPDASAASPAPASPVQQAPAPAPVVTPNIPVQLPPSVFTPTPNDVLSAFAQSLAGTVLRMPASAQRDEWYQEQVLTLKTLKVGGCTQSTAGTKSTCRVSLAGQEFDAHLLLTKEGWTLVE